MDEKPFYTTPSRLLSRGLFAVIKKDQSPESDVEVMHPQWQWVRFFSILTAILIGLGIGAVLLYHVAKVWRARSLVSGISEQSTGQASADAEGRLMAALQLEPYDSIVLRACAHYEQATGNPNAIAFYHRLLTLPKVRREDVRDALRACLTFNNLTTAEGLARVLTAKDPEAEDFALAAQVRWQEHEANQAASLMRRALALAPENRDDQLLLGQMLVSSGTDGERAEAMKILRSVAETKDADGLKALIAISHSPGLDEASQRDVMEQLQQHPLLDDEGRFAAWDLEAHLGDRDPKTVWEEAVDFFKGADLSRKSVAARWLLDHEGDPDMALELASPPDTASSQDLLLVRLDSLDKLNQWQEMEKELADPQLPLPSTLVFRYRAIAALGLGDSAGSQADWERARTAASVGDKKALADLGNYLLGLGLYDEAKKTFSLMAQTPGQAQAGYTALLQVEAHHGSTSELLATLKQMMTDLPMDPEPKNDWAYLNLLLNTNVDEAWNTAQALVADHPQMLAYRSTLALGYLRRNDFRGAKQVYEGLLIDWSDAPASWKMVHAVVLAAGGEMKLAKAFDDTIDRSQLRAEELALLEAYLPEEQPKPAQEINSAPPN